MLDAHKHFDSTVIRTQPNELSFSDPAVLPILYSHGKAFEKSDFYARRKMYQVRIVGRRKHLIGEDRATADSNCRKIISSARATQLVTPLAASWPLKPSPLSLSSNSR